MKNVTTTNRNFMTNDLVLGLQTRNTSSYNFATPPLNYRFQILVPIISCLLHPSICNLVFLITLFTPLRNDRGFDLAYKSFMRNY